MVKSFARLLLKPERSSVYKHDSKTASKRLRELSQDAYGK